MTNGSGPSPGTRKVTVGALGGAVVTIVAYTLSQNGITLPQEVFGAASTVVTAVFVYMTRETFS